VIFFFILKEHDVIVLERGGSVLEYLNRSSEKSDLSALINSTG
jgi:hypothetical protein